MKSLKKFNNFINEDHLSGGVGETSEEHQHQHYMFFENLQTIKRCIDDLLTLDETEIDKILSSGHDWASDHMATAKEDIEQVHNFMKNNTTGEDHMERELGYDSEDYNIDDTEYED